MALTIDHSWLLTSIASATEKEIATSIEKTLLDSVLPQVREIAVKSAKVICERAQVHIEKNYQTDQVNIRYFFGDQEFKLDD